LQRATWQTLHHDEGFALVVAAVMHANDVGMAQSSSSTRFVLEPAPDVRLCVERRVQSLDGDGPIESGVPTVPDLGHSAASEKASDLITTHEQFVVGHGHRVAPSFAPQTPSRQVGKTLRKIERPVANSNLG
jgi:hypothetical protein